MKIVTWNINGYRSITGQNPSRRYDKVTKENRLFEYIEKEKPDIICLQEIKADLEQINEELRQPEGYTGYYNPCRIKKGYSGVVTFSKYKPASINTNIGIDRFDGEGRIMELDFEDFILLNIYFPKGYADSDRLGFKLDFYDAIFDYTNKLRKKGRQFIVSGDYNTAHKDIDLARPKENEGTSGFMPIEREKLDWMASNGWIDAFRVFVSDGGNYTWWSQRGRARDNNIGWRIDYHFSTEKLAQNLISASQQPEIMGSDHCPVLIELEL
jgi:exodeoxyribonuclease-3